MEQEVILDSRQWRRCINTIMKKAAATYRLKKNWFSLHVQIQHLLQNWMFLYIFVYFWIILSVVNCTQLKAIFFLTSQHKKIRLILCHLLFLSWKMFRSCTGKQDKNMDHILQWSSSQCSKTCIILISYQHIISKCSLDVQNILLFFFLHF